VRVRLVKADEGDAAQPRSEPQFAPMPVYPGMEARPSVLRFFARRSPR
jgi:hypothetical protein